MKTLAATVRAPDPPRALARVTVLLETGFASLVLDDPLHHLSWKELRKLLPRETIAAIRLFLPYPAGLRPGTPSPFRLGSLHSEERRDGLKQAAATVTAAAEHSIPLILLPVARFDPERPDRTPQPPSSPASTAVQPKRQRVLDAYKSSLSRLLDLADRHERILCITPSTRPDELPDTQETDACLREFEGAPLGSWLDTARLPAEFTAEGEETLQDGTVSAGQQRDIRGVSIHDTRDGEEGLVPGSGELDWDQLQPSLRSASVWTLDLRVGAPASEAREGYEFLEARGRTPQDEVWK